MRVCSYVETNLFIISKLAIAGIFGQSLVPNKSLSLSSFKLDDRLSLASQVAAVPKISTPLSRKFSKKSRRYEKENSLPPSSLGSNQSFELNFRPSELEYDVPSFRFSVDADDPFGFLAVEKKLKLKRNTQKEEPRPLSRPSITSLM